MRPLVHDLIVVEVSSHTAKTVSVKSYKGLEKSLYDFTGTIFVACVNSYFTLRIPCEPKPIDLHSDARHE